MDAITEVHINKLMIVHNEKYIAWIPIFFVNTGLKNKSNI